MSLLSDALDANRHLQAALNGLWTGDLAERSIIEHLAAAANLTGKPWVPTGADALLSGPIPAGKDPLIETDEDLFAAIAAEVATADIPSGQIIADGAMLLIRTPNPNPPKETS